MRVIRMMGHDNNSQNPAPGRPGLVDTNGSNPPLTRQFENAGFTLLSIVSLDQLPQALSEAIGRSAAQAGLDTGRDALRVMVVGNGGGGFWSSLSDADRQVAEPIDDYSLSRIRTILDAVPGFGAYRFLYPGQCSFSLQQLGLACGWGHPSWLGVSIHPEFGTWFAFRAVVVTNTPLPVNVLEGGADICARCDTRDCLQACPVGAPGEPGQFDLEACISQRLKPKSVCASDCPARQGCPVGSGHRYPDSLMAYLYTRSLASIRRWTQEHSE